MYRSETLLIKLVKAGARGFLDKNIHPTELNTAIEEALETGYYFTAGSAAKMASFLRHTSTNTLSPQQVVLTDKEVKFLRLSCSELTYKEIAACMSMGPRTIDNMRDSLFIKLDIKSRVGLAMFAMRNGLGAGT
jgi:two-component system, NarL family, invasion response regulator UvrY